MPLTDTQHTILICVAFLSIYAAVLLWTAAADDTEAEAARFATANPQAYEGIKTGYDRSKKTYTRTDYEVDFAAAYNKLCNLGAKFNANAYLTKVPVRSLI